MNKTPAKSKFNFAHALVLAVAMFGITASGLQAKVHAPAPTRIATERIDSFNADLKLSKNGILDVSESINMNFGHAQRHGIFRFIPTSYDRGRGKYNLLFRFLDVTDENGQKYRYTQSQDGDNVTIKVGDPNVTTTGKHLYKFHYTVAKAVNFFDKQPELYWNVTGDQWPYPIGTATAVVHLPVAANQTNCEAFAGPPGSKNAVSPTYNGNIVRVKAGPINAGEGLTIADRMPLGAVVLPTVSQEFIWFVRDWYEAFLLPLLTVFVLYVYWSYFGKDRDSGKAVGVEWEPPKDLTPAEVGTLVDEKCDFPDITSTLIDLAARGYIKIEQIPYNGILMLSDKDYIFTKLSGPTDAPPLKVHETMFMDAVFGIGSSVSRLSELRGSFYPYIKHISDAVYDSLLTKKYFARDPEVDRETFTRFGILIIIAGLFFVMLAGNDLRAASIGFLLSGIVVALSANFMPAKTALGSEALRQCLAFQRFVRAAEKKRIEVLAKDDPTLFGRLLPYAMVLGCADHWANAFKDLMVKPPDWYGSSQYDSGQFSSYIFVEDLGNSMHTINQTFQSPPTPMFAGGSSSTSGWSSGSSAGGGFSGIGDGGFSGGGFGGGGGGSW